MGIIDPLGRPVFPQFPDGSVATSKYQGWCAKHGKVWMYDEVTKKPKVNGVCGICYRLARTPGYASCARHGITKIGPGGRCGECEAAGYPPMEDYVPALDEIDDDPGGTVPKGGVVARNPGDAKPLP